MAPRLRDRNSVVRACAEYDRLGQDGFLAEYGFGEATVYLLKYKGRLYDSKAIVGVAFGYEHPAEGPLRAHDFSGGVSTGAAAWQLAKLGFEIVERST
jgi:hypothetical protein